MANYVLTRPSFAGYANTSASYQWTTSASAQAGASGGNLGSVREITLEVNAEVLKATSNTYNDATVATALSGYSGTLTIQCEEITSSAMLQALGGFAGTSSAFYFDGTATTPTNYAIVSYPWYVDGSAFSLVCTKCNVIPNATRKLGKEQEILEIKYEVLVDVDASTNKKFLRFIGQS